MRSSLHRIRFERGYQFREFQGQPDANVVTLPMPERVTVEFPFESVPSVSVGDSVGVGQVISAPAPETTAFRPIVSPVAGTVEAVEGRTLVIVSSGDQSLPSEDRTWSSLGPDELEDLLVQTGTWNVCAEGIPTHRGTASIAPESVDLIVVAHDDTNLYTPSAEAVLGGRGAEELVAGIGILARILPNARSHLVLGTSQENLLEACEDAAKRASLELGLHVGTRKYPQYHRAELVASVLDDSVSGERTYPNALVLDLQGILQVYDAVVHGKPFVERVVGLCGPGFMENTCVRARIGTSLDRTVAGRTSGEVRYVLNSAMNGPSLDPETSVGPDWTNVIGLPEAVPELIPFMALGATKDSYTRTFLSALLPTRRTADTNLHGDERPCISCTFCERVCPAGILPWHLHRYVQRDIIDENLVRYGIFRCTECNLCSYICPSKIPLANLIATGKERLLDEGFEPVGSEPAAILSNMTTPASDEGISR